MGVENVCTSIALDLGLGCHQGRLHETPPLKEKPSFKFDDLFFTSSSSTSMEIPPSLTLGLSKGCEEVTTCDTIQPHTPLSSFSNTSIKRERDYAISNGGSEEMELERVSSRISDEDDEGINGRKKLRLTKEQSALLEESFKEHTTLNPKQKQALARELNLRPRQVEVWFQNRRARTKLKQTEVDCEVLRKCCQTLTDENRRLHKELQELKALNHTPPLYMQLPAATLSMCPSCEKIGGGVGGGGVGEGSSKPNTTTTTTTQFTMATKSHFFNPFAHPSTAC